MSTFITKLEDAIYNFLVAEMGEGCERKWIILQETRKEFEGDFTLVTFPMLRWAKQKPEQLGETIGKLLVEKKLIAEFNVVKGFLNMSFPAAMWVDFMQGWNTADELLPKANSKHTVMVEYSSPNTNKPLHLGHIRNNLLGYAVAEILKANGHQVIKTQIINDRGIHICKSMVAWQRFGEGKTPDDVGVKGDKLVGEYYVRFDQEYKKEQEELIQSKGLSKEEAAQQAPIFLEAKNMLKKWEDADPEVMALWKKMNDWVYQGFDKTYKRLGVDFDKLYYESETYLHGRDKVLEGVEKGLFTQREDGSVWADLTGDGLDEKLLLRSDGTSVYMTQDIGTAALRLEDYPDIRQMIYTVGNEQDYHFKVLFILLEKLGYDWAKQCFHLSYGMVDLPTGKMKSREGTVVDADDLMQKMYVESKAVSEELGKLDASSEEEREEIYEQVGMAALKYYILKVDPKKRMMFNPEESIDFNGNTGPFVQYAHARIQAILRRANEAGIEPGSQVASLEPKERDLVKKLALFGDVLQESADAKSPATIANYVYDVVKAYNSFYQSLSIFNEEQSNVVAWRVSLSKQTGQVIKRCLQLLGIVAPERM